jgi:hypothetical protein
MGHTYVWVDVEVKLIHPSSAVRSAQLCRVHRRQAEVSGGEWRSAEEVGSVM